MFIVAPIGNTNRVTLGSTLFFCSIAAMVTGKVADEDAVPKAVNKALPMFMMYRNGIVLVISPVLVKHEFKDTILDETHALCLYNLMH